MFRRYVRTILSAIVLLAIALGCSGSGDSGPKKTVISLFGAMEKDDQASLTYLLDLSELMRNINEDYAIQTDSPRSFTNPQQILDDLTGDGLTKSIWFSHQRIINKTEMISDTTASVEVTFVNKEKSTGYLTRFGLHKIHGKWKIYSFRTVR